MNDNNIHIIVKILKKVIKKWKKPVVGRISKKKDPFKILISTIISLRTKDQTTYEVSTRLFKLVSTPEDIIKIDKNNLEKILYPAGFYRNKAQNILNICKDLIEKYNGSVPDNIDELLKLKGVGRKTANLVITLGYNKPGICVDTHVHRISNRLGYVKTKTPEQTELSLRKKLPLKYWIIFNDLLVTFGQNQCTPISPYCSICEIFNYCDRINVVKYR